VTLVARDSRQVAEALGEQTAAQVRYLERSDGQGRRLALEEVMEILDNGPELHLLIVSGPVCLEIIPYDG